MLSILLTPRRSNLARGTSGSFGVPAGEGHDKNQEGEAADKKEDKRSPPTLAMLDSYALERWEVRFSTRLSPLPITQNYSDRPPLHGLLK